MTDVQQDRSKLAELIDDIPIAMFTTLGPRGPRSLPMARQTVDADADMWFITARDTAHIAEIVAEPSVALTFSSTSSWVALRGQATVVDDRAKLEQLWNTFAEAWLPGGPENPDAVLIHVSIDEGEYWDTPGSRIATLISLAKTKLKGEVFEADHGTVDATNDVGGDVTGRARD